MSAQGFYLGFIYNNWWLAIIIQLHWHFLMANSCFWLVKILLQRSYTYNNYKKKTNCAYANIKKLFSFKIRPTDPWCNMLRTLETPTKCNWPQIGWYRTCKTYLAGKSKLFSFFSNSHSAGVDLLYITYKNIAFFCCWTVVYINKLSTWSHRHQTNQSWSSYFF